MPELAGRPGGSKDKPAVFDDRAADTGVHVQVQERTGAHRSAATRFGDGGKAGVVADQKGPVVQLARPENAEIDVLPSEVRRLGEVVVDHCAGDGDRGYPDTAAVAPPDRPQCLSQLAHDLVGVPSVCSLGLGYLGPAKLCHGELPGLMPDGGGDHEGPSWMGVQGRRGPAAPTGRGCRSFGDKVEGNETGHRFGDETARHGRLTSYGNALDTRSLVDGPDDRNSPRGPPHFSHHPVGRHFTRLPSITCEVRAICHQTVRRRIAGFDKLWSLKSRLEIPLAHVRGATADPGVAHDRGGWRGPGTYVPGVLTAGTFHQDGDRVFWDVHDPAQAIIVELDDERYQRLVVQVDDPKSTAETINRAVDATAHG